MLRDPDLLALMLLTSCRYEIEGWDLVLRVLLVAETPQVNKHAIVRSYQLRVNLWTGEDKALHALILIPGKWLD